MTGRDRFELLIGSAAQGKSLTRQAVRGGGYTLGAEGVDFLLRVGSIMVLARMLLPEHFGLIAMVTAITALAERFKDLGLSLATVQRESITHEQVSTLFWVNVVLGVGSALVVVGLAWPLAHFYGDERVRDITLAIAFTFLTGGLTVQHLAILRRSMKFRAVAIIQIGSSAASIVVAILMAWAGFDYWALVVREIARSLFLSIGAWIACRWIPGKPAWNQDIREMVAFGAHLTGVQMAYEVSANFGHVLMGRLFGATAAGSYRQGVQLVLGPINQLTDPINLVAESTLSRLQNEPETYRIFYRNLVVLVAGITMPLIMILCIQAEETVLTVLGEGWESAVPIFRWLALGGFLAPTVGTIGAAMVTCGYGKRYFRIGLAHAGVLVMLSLIGTRWGPSGIAAAHLSTLLIMLPARLYWGLRGTPVTALHWTSALVRPLVSSLVMAIGLLGLHQVQSAHAVVELATAIVTGLAIYLLCWACLPGGRNELAGLADGLRGALRRSPTS